MSKMNFDQFTKEVVAKVREYLPETFKDASLELTHVIKNNDMKFTGLVIKTADNCVFPTIYLDRFFENYQSGEDIGQVIHKIADIRVNNEVKNTFDIGQIMDFDRVKSKIIPRLIAKDWNKTLLKNQPNTDVADLVATYHVVLGNETGRLASAPITNALLEEWGVNIEEIHNLSIKNIHTMCPSTFRGMSAVLNSMFTGEDNNVINPGDEIMFVLSNKNGLYGASAVLDNRIMKKIVDRFGEDFYILPSSIHEVLIVPETSDIRVEQLEGMVQEINKSTVSSEDRLSDHVYRYSLSDGLTLALAR